MKIGKLVKLHIKEIFRYCEVTDHDELNRLTDKRYSKKIFDINFPFCSEISSITSEDSKRYWTNRYLVQGKTVRVSSQWFDKSKHHFVQYLISNNISTDDAISSLAEDTPVNDNKQRRPSRRNSRYRGNAIGNAQNLLVRNILSNLGDESFSDQDWKETKEYFSNKCAYCGAEGELVIEHVIPINRVALGEHKLGNLIPSCRSCNSSKADKSYLEFLEGKTERIEKIQDYMESRNYVPLGDNEQVAMILDMAYKEVAAVSKRYIEVLNELFPNN